MGWLLEVMRRERDEARGRAMTLLGGKGVARGSPAGGTDSAIEG